MLPMLIVLTILAAVSSLAAVARAVAGDGLGHRPPPLGSHEVRARWAMPHDEIRRIA